MCCLIKNRFIGKSSHVRWLAKETNLVTLKILRNFPIFYSCIPDAIYQFVLQNDIEGIKVIIDYWEIYRN